MVYKETVNYIVPNIPLR